MLITLKNYSHLKYIRNNDITKKTINEDIFNNKILLDSRDFLNNIELSDIINSLNINHILNPSTEQKLIINFPTLYNKNMI